MLKGSTTLTLSILVIFLCPPTSATPECKPNDQKLLLQIKAALNNPSILSSWIPQVDCCNWSSVGCDRFSKGHVTSISITGHISGSGIPPAIGNLPYLKNLAFNDVPNLTGHIPSAFAKLVHLQQLSITGSNLSGPVPCFLGNLKKLYILELSSNHFTGAIPPCLSKLPLSVLSLQHNKLTGCIPDTFGRWGGGFTPVINLSHNNLTGNVPRSLGNLTLLIQIDLSSNKLEGDPSFLFDRNKKWLDSVYLSRNKFQFDLSKVEFSDSFWNLDLSHNKIFGNIPQELAQLNLQFINVSYNRLCGEIPQGGKLQSFDVSSYFHNRCLCGAPLSPCL